MPQAQLSADEVARALSFLSPEEIMPLRRVNMTWKDAAKKTIVPPTNFIVNSVKRCNAMEVMARALPNLQQVTLRSLRCGEIKYNDGEDPDEELATETADWTAHNIGIIFNFSKLRILTIESSSYQAFSAIKGAELNGRYPFLFTSFPLLQKLSIKHCDYLKWDLEMLAGFPLLKELVCMDNRSVTGNIRSLRVLKDTLENVRIYYCTRVEGNLIDLAGFPHLNELCLINTCVTGNISSLSLLKDTLEKVTICGYGNVEGDFMDLADFPRLKVLKLHGNWSYINSVTGDIRDIGETDFSSLEYLALPKTVYGGDGYELQRISDAPDLVRAVYLFRKQRPSLKMQDWYATLSEDSFDWYESVDEYGDNPPPFYVRFVKAGCRVGYRWETEDDDPCEVNWLDPEPESGSSDYEDYAADYQRIQKADFYRGYYDPPTEEEYNLLYGNPLRDW